MLVGPGATAPGSVHAASGSPRIGSPTTPVTGPTASRPRRARVARVAGAGRDGRPRHGPSIIALDAAAHAEDRIAFTPGARGQRARSPPRADDRWTVGGVDAPPAAGRGRHGPIDGRQPPGDRLGPGLGRAAGVGPAGCARAAPTGRHDERPAGAARPTRPASRSSRARPTVGRPRPATCAARSSGSCRTGSSATPRPGSSTTCSRRSPTSGSAPTSTGDLRQAQQRRLDRRSAGPAGPARRMTSVINEAHRHGTRVVLTVQSFAWTTGQAREPVGPARERRRPPEARPPDRRGGPGPGRRRREPRLRAARPRVGPTSSWPSSGRCGSSWTSWPRATSSPSTRPARSATTRSRPRRPRARPTPSSSWATTTGPPARRSAGSVAPLTGPGYDLTDTVRAFTDRVAPSKVILGIPYYGRAWSTVSDAPNARTQTGPKYGPSASVTYANAVELAGDERPPLRRRRGVGLDRLSAQELHRDLRLRHDAGARSTTTTPRASGRSTT